MNSINIVELHLWTELMKTLSVGQAVMVPTFSPSSWEAEAGGPLMSSRKACSTD